MEKLTDYNAEFIPDLKLSDFTTAILVKLLTLYAKLYLAMDASWYSAVEKGVGKKALEVYGSG